MRVGPSSAEFSRIKCLVQGRRDARLCWLIAIIGYSVREIYRAIYHS